MIDKEKVIRYIEVQKEDPFMLEISEKFLSWIEGEKVRPVGKFLLELLQKAENGDFKSNDKD